MTNNKQTAREPAIASTRPEASPSKPRMQQENRTNVAAGRPERPGQPGGKLGRIATLITRPEGATLQQLKDATDWQAHSIRGAMSGTLTKKHGFAIVSEKSDGARVYRARSEAVR